VSEVADAIHRNLKWAWHLLLDASHTLLDLSLCMPPWHVEEWRCSCSRPYPWTPRPLATSGKGTRYHWTGARWRGVEHVCVILNSAPRVNLMYRLLAKLMVHPTRWRVLYCWVPVPPGFKRIHILSAVLTHLKYSGNYVYRCVLNPHRVYMVFVWYHSKQWLFPSTTTTTTTWFVLFCLPGKSVAVVCLYLDIADFLGLRCQFTFHF